MGEVEAVEKPPERDLLTGRFLKGNKYRPKNPPARKVNSIDFLKAVTEDAYTPQELTRMLQDTYNVAKGEGDSKVMLGVLHFIMAYAVGKPVQRSLSATMDVGFIQKLFFGEEPQEEEYVDGVAEVVDESE